MLRVKRNWKETLPAKVEAMGPFTCNDPDFSQVISNLKDQGAIPRGYSKRDFISFFEETDIVQRATVRHVGKANPKKDIITRYNFNKASAFSVALSLRSNSFMTHISALYLHGLTQQIPKVIYVNKEQSEKKKVASRGLTQAGIHRAFANSVRRSQYIWAWDNSRIVLLNGKQSGNYGVIGHSLSNGEKITVTGLERTLIDIVVRPNYSGGVFEISEAYSRAMDRIDVDKLLAMLVRLDYTYPYHQSIGFLLERSGCGEDQLSKIEKLGLDHDFYIDYKIGNPEYNERWRLLYPKGL